MLQSNEQWLNVSCYSSAVHAFYTMCTYFYIPRRRLMKKTINYIGWLGHNNLGDEALFAANQQIFNKFRLINKHQLYDSPVSLFGGGTVLPEWAYDVQINRYNYAFGVGVKDPVH